MLKLQNCGDNITDEIILMKMTDATCQELYNESKYSNQSIVKIFYTSMCISFSLSLFYCDSPLNDVATFFSSSQLFFFLNFVLSGLEPVGSDPDPDPTRTRSGSGPGRLRVWKILLIGLEAKKF